MKYYNFKNFDQLRSKNGKKMKECDFLKSTAKHIRGYSLCQNLLKFGPDSL